MSILMEKDISFLKEKDFNNKINYKFELTTLNSKENEKGWERLISEVFAFDCNIDKNLKNEEAYSPNRVFILKDGKKVIGTASAWYRPIYGEEYGYLHMVAIDPEYRGQGLSYVLVNEVIKFFIKEGRNKIILKTDEFRREAINLYQKLGFSIVEDRV